MKRLLIVMAIIFSMLPVQLVHAGSPSGIVTIYDITTRQNIARITSSTAFLGIRTVSLIRDHSYMITGTASDDAQVNSVVMDIGNTPASIAFWRNYRGRTYGQQHVNADCNNTSTLYLTFTCNTGQRIYGGRWYGTVVNPTIFTVKQRMQWSFYRRGVVFSSPVFYVTIT